MAVEEMASKRKSVLSEKDGEDSERKVGEKGRQEEEVKENKRGIEGGGGGNGMRLKEVDIAMIRARRTKEQTKG